MYKDICKAILTPEYGKCDYKSIGSGVKYEKIKTTAQVSSSKQTLVPFSLPFTCGVSPAFSLAMVNTRRFPGPPLCVPVGCRWVRRLLWGQSPRRWPRLPHSKQSIALRMGCKGERPLPRHLQLVHAPGQSFHSLV
ncbi:hypothetical protein T05_13405 [Trichinella murrelli]|uniref:Uncharacterized protein n=1 Tax=Trichinella murrelli TaxID=144512 RepID=A0A0V0TBA1_9BILA|nr:hypothetical protein T05_13405 [Trichinella murrelli]